MLEPVNSPRQTVNLPVCIGGYIKAEKEGYMPAVVPIDTMPGDKQQITISMTKLTSLAVDVELVAPNSTSSASSLGDGQTVLITISSAQQTNLAPTFVRTVEVGGDKEATTTLGPGSYEVRATLIDEEGFTIPESVVEVPGGGSYKVQEIEMKPATLGGLELNSRTGVWTLTKNRLKDKTKLTFKIIAIDTPTTIDDLADLNKITQYSDSMRGELEPDLN